MYVILYDLIKPISITSITSVSALGDSKKTVWNSYLDNSHLLREMKFGNTGGYVASLSKTIKSEVETLRSSNENYKKLDNTVLYALHAARKAVKLAGWEKECDLGINIGSSRGATGLFENYHKDFLASDLSTPLASPTTTLGNISSWVAHDLQTTGPDISHSITCSTALHALLNGIAWIHSGMAEKFLVGGSEAPLTPFTIAQMQALKIYARKKDNYPCKALDLSKKYSSMVLGEGASIACIEGTLSDKTLAVVEGIGYATEPLEHSVSISIDAACFQRSMKMALGNVSPSEVDVIVMHAPGTLKGDLSEYNAITHVFGSKLPLLTTNKWKIGHTLGASGMLSLEMAILMLQHQHFIPVPYLDKESATDKIRRILINAVGFGGNAVSILIKHPGIKR